MARTGGWRRAGSRRHFRYLDSRWNRIADPAKLARIESLRIPPAWRDVWISPRPNAALQATGLDAAGRRQHLYHPEYRAQRERAKYDRLIRFAERLPAFRGAMVEHMDHDSLDRERISAIAVRLIDLGWFRVGSDRYARESRTYGITTLTKRHLSVRGSKITLQFRGKNKTWVRSAVADAELAGSIRELLTLPGGRRLFRYEWEGDLYNLTGKRLNDYVRIYDFRPRHLRVVGARDIGLDLEEHALLSLLRSWRIRRAREAA